jgi:hypothetical protein
VGNYADKVMNEVEAISISFCPKQLQLEKMDMCLDENQGNHVERWLERMNEVEAISISFCPKQLQLEKLDMCLDENQGNQDER